mgnify:CR=1 FL=1
MVAFDTHVLVRVLVGDDPAQTRLAERAWVRHARHGGVYISLVVLAEIAWVNDDGELGLGDTATRGDAAGELGDALPEVDL